MVISKMISNRPENYYGIKDILSGLVVNFFLSGFIISKGMQNQTGMHNG